MANNKHTHPNFDCTKVNSFQLITAATDGNDVIPNITEKAKDTTPLSSFIVFSNIKKYKLFHSYK